MHENVPFPLIKNKSSREGIILTVRNCQNHRNEASLIVGNLAAAIAAKNEREATPHTPRYARTRRRQFVVEVYLNLGPSYFRRAYCMTYESFCHLHHKLSFPWDQSSCESPEKISTEGIAIVNFQATSRSQQTNTYVHSFGMCIAILCGGVSI